VEEALEKEPLVPAAAEKAPWRRSCRPLGRLRMDYRSTFYRKTFCRSNCPCLRRPHFCVDRNGGKNQPRPHKLHIVRFRLKPKARSFRCSSSPQQTRFAGLCRGPEAAFGNRGAHASVDVCLWSALSVVCYSRSLSPPGFAANVLLRWLLCPDRSRVQ
jgi:hypothetical protein